MKSTGGGTADAMPYVVPTNAVQGVDAKLAAVAALDAQTAASKSSASSKGATVNTLPVGVGVTSYQLGTVYIHREGQGDSCTPGSTDCSASGIPYYTCAAASMRNRWSP